MAGESPIPRKKDSLMPSHVKCTMHSAHEMRIKGVEKDVDEIVKEIKAIRSDITKLKVDMGKFGAILAVLLTAIQIGLRFLPGG